MPPPRRQRSTAVAGSRAAAIRPRRRWRAWVALGLWSAALVVGLALTGTWAGSWHYVVTGFQVLTGPDPLGLYATHPQIQMGPLTFVVGAPFAALPEPIGTILGPLAMEAAGLLALHQVRMLLPAGEVAHRRWFVGAAVAMVGWSELSVRFGHLDDALALLAAVCGLRLLRRGSTAGAAIAFGLATDCKPWIAPIILVLLAAPRGQRLRALALAAFTVAIAWSPFLLNPETIRAARYAIEVQPGATIRLLGLADTTTPPWCRPAQLIGGAALVAVAAATGRWRAALLLVVTTRMLLDPATHAYFGAGLLLAACLLDTGAVRPLATPVALLGVHLSRFLAPFGMDAVAVTRAAGLALLVLLAFVLLRRPAGSHVADAGVRAGPGATVRELPLLAGVAARGSG